MSKRLDIPVWVLNLECDTERQRFMQQQLEAMDIDYELIKAIDKEVLTSEDLQCYSAKEAIKSIGRELSRGEIACALSHVNMWERIVQEHYPEVLILEDDIRISWSLTAILAHRHKFPPDYEFINFSTDTPQVPFGEFITDIYRASNHKQYAALTSAYLITRKGASKLLAKAYPIQRAADGLTGRTYITGLNSYGIYPKVALINPDFESSIWQHETVPKTKLFSRGNLKLQLGYCREAIKQIAEIIRYGTVQF